MCMSCGCGEPQETHGDKRSIIYGDLKKASDASKNLGQGSRTEHREDAPDQGSSFACRQMTVK